MEAETTIRRHHLIDEAKSELDVAYDEVSMAESQIIDTTHSATELRTNDFLMALRKARKASIERLSLLSACYEHIFTLVQAKEAANLAKYNIFRKMDIEGNEDLIHQLTLDFCNALHDYTFLSSSESNDQRVRQTWDSIEIQLREFGRII